MSDIVERLRKLADRERPYGSLPDTLDEAADEIDHLRAGNQKAALEYLGQIGQLSDENTRLRAALHRIGLPRAKIVYCRDGHEEAVLIARAALEGR